jgi:acyl-CoA reductase-like NAD-dependent aldehyde dehydrogenase
VQTQLFIGGEFVDTVDGATIDVVDPHDGSVLAKVALAGTADVDRAVAAAAAALDGWRGAAAAERGRLLLRLADLVEEHGDELALLETRDTGHPIRDSRALDVPRTAATFRYFGGMADKHHGRVVPVDPGFLNYVLREPVGVVGQIVPWNFPLMFTSWKLGPALAAGNAVVLKPSEITPLSSLRIAELIVEAGFPPGVVNIVPGAAEAGARIANHPDIALVSFTGSTPTGRTIVTASAGNLKRVHLELGGKGANIVFADANLDAAVNGSAFAIFHNQGQACIAGSRLLLHEAIADEFLAGFGALARRIRVGDPKRPETQLGPLTSAVHRDRVLAHLEAARAEGAVVVSGGGVPADPTLSGGMYVEPTIVDAHPRHRIAREEVFGPVVVVHTFRDDEEAVRLANGVEYGLGAGLWTRDLSRAHRVAGALRAGMVWVNSYKRVNPGSPFGGVGMSGHGREMGFEAMDEYTQARSVWVNVDAQLPPWYGRG